MDTSAGTIQVMKEGKIKTVSSDRVTSVMNMVMSDPQVTSYLDRKGAIQAMGMSEKELAEMKLTRMGQIQQTLSKVQEELGKTKDPEERAQLESMAANLLTNAGTIEGMNTPEQLRAWAATERAKQIEGTYRNAAQSRYGYYSQTVDTQIAPQWMQAIAGNGGVGASSIYTSVPGALTAVNNPDGATVDAITASIANYSTTLNQLQDPEYMKQQYGLPISGSEILNMSTEDFQQRFPTYDISLFNKAKSAVTTATAMKAAAQTRLAEVRNTLNLSTDTFVENVKASVVGAAPLLSQISSELNISEAEAIDLLRYKFSKSTAGPSGLISTILGALGESGEPEYEEPNAAAMQSLNKILFDTDGVTLKQFDGRGVGAIFNGIEYLYKGDVNKIDEYLEQNSTTISSMPVSTTIPFYMSDAEKRSLQEMFKSGTAAVSGEGAYLDASGNLVSFDLAVESIMPLQRNAQGFDTSTAKLVSSMFAPYNISGTGGTMQLQYEDENGKSVYVAMPFIAIDNPGINRYEGSIFNKFATIVGSKRARNVENITIAAYDANNNRFELRVNMVDGGAKTVTAVDAAGNDFAVYDFDTMLQPGGPLDNLQKRGGRIEYL